MGLGLLSRRQEIRGKRGCSVRVVSQTQGVSGGESCLQGPCPLSGMGGEDAVRDGKYLSQKGNLPPAFR